MQETRYEGMTVQKMFRGSNMEEIEAAMDASLRPGEEVVRRVELDQPTVHAMNRHERRKAAALARRRK